MTRWLQPLNPLYAAAVRAKNLAWDRGWRQPQRLGWPVVSVGNLSVGGAGKTPLVIRLAELLRDRGVAVDVLSRGYGRASGADPKTAELVDPAGEATRFGDEPLLIARSTGVPVVVAASRYRAGLLAEGRAADHFAGRGIHLLDDGFQHRQLARAADIVLLHRSDFSQGLLPAGRLREPLTSLRRASAIVLRAEDADLEVEARLRDMGLTAPIWLVRRALKTPDLPPGRVLAFCGIARPEEFFASLRRAGVPLAAEQAFADHHRYSVADLDRLIALAAALGASAFVTTEKDAVRLTAADRDRLKRAAPLATARLSVTLQDEEAVLRQILEWTGL